MVDSTRDSDAIIGAAGRSLQVQREGGTHRPAKSIGRFSAEAKSKHWKKKIRQSLIALAGILAVAVAIGRIIDGIGFTGIMLTLLAAAIALALIARNPKIQIPRRNELKKGDPRQMVANTELWLEAQRPALPLPAVQLVDKLGLQLDTLGIQLATVDPGDPAVNEVRELVGEYIPETIDNYRKIPQHLRQETHAGKSADDRLSESLGKLSDEVDRVTRRLAEGALDDLAIKSRYLDYRFGDAEVLENHHK